MNTKELALYTLHISETTAPRMLLERRVIHVVMKRALALARHLGFKDDFGCTVHHKADLSVPKHAAAEFELKMHRILNQLNNSGFTATLISFQEQSSEQASCEANQEANQYPDPEFDN